MNWVKRFLRSEDGPTAVEYAVLLALIFLTCVIAVRAVGNATAGSLQDSQNKLEQTMNPEE